MEVEDVADIRVAGVGLAHACGVGDHRRHFGGDDIGRVREENGVAVALAHFTAVGAEELGGFGEDHLRLGEDGPVEVVEAAGDLARDLDVRRLVHPDRDAEGLVHDDVGRLQDGVAQEPEGGEVLAAELLDLVLVGWVALEPGHRGDH